MTRAAHKLAISAVIALIGLASCDRRPLMEEEYITARIAVQIDWSQSGIPVTIEDPTGGEFVHRVSFRFFPHDGSPVFERYLEGNIFSGTIDVPIGKYDIVVMNESVSDLYWRDAVTFSDVDDFDTISATVDPMPAADMASRFPFYTPDAGERVIIEPLRLASWSVEDFDVTSDLVIHTRQTRETRGEMKAETRRALDTFTSIVMRKLTHSVNVTAHVQNLISAQTLYVAAKGFADKVYLASAETAPTPATNLFTLNGRVMDENGRDGSVRRSFLSFGRLPQGGAYTIDLDVALVTGELFDEDEGHMIFDVTGQVLSSLTLDIDIELANREEPIELPYLEGGISVDDWNDEEIGLN